MPPPKATLSKMSADLLPSPCPDSVAIAAFSLARPGDFDMMRPRAALFARTTPSLQSTVRQVVAAPFSS